MTQLSTSLGNYDDSLDLARTGLYALPRTETLVRAELLGLESRAYAQLGPTEAPDAARSAETCVEVALQADDPSRWRAYAGRAEHHTLRARQTRADGYDRSRILDEIRLAKVRLSQRELGEALLVATEALRLAEATRSSVVHDWLIRFHNELAERHAGESAVREFADGLRGYLRKAAPSRVGDVCRPTLISRQWTAHRQRSIWTN